jgi:hypothetical protein
VCKHLLAQFVHKLIKAQIDFRFDLIVQVLFAERDECTVCTVVVEIELVKETSVLASVFALPVSGLTLSTPDCDP